MSCMWGWTRKGFVVIGRAYEAGEDVQQVRVINPNRNLLMSDESVLRWWKEYFEEMVNEENERGRQFVNQEVQKISEEDVRAA